MARPEPTAKPNPRIIVLASICVIVAALYFAQDVLIPLALAVLLSFLLAPVVGRLERLHLGRKASVIIVVLLSFSLIGSLMWVLSNQVVQLANDLPRYEDNILKKISSIHMPGGNVVGGVKKTVEDINKAIETLPATTQASTTQPATRDESEKPPVAASTESQPIPVRVVRTDSTTFEFVRDTLGPLVSPLATAGIVIVLVIFMLLERENLRDRLIRLVGHGQLQLTTQAIDDAATRISRYLLMQLLINGTYGICVVIGLALIGTFIGGQTFPNLILWGLICGVLRFIPYLGPWIGSAFPIAISILVFPGYSVLLATLTLLIVIELFTNNVMEPWLYGSSTGLSTVAILVAAIFWTWLWGPIGLLLSTPLTVCFIVMGKYVPQMAFLDVLLGDEPPFEPPVQLYQRLLAMDEEEPATILREYKKDHSMQQTYDDLLMPALAMAEQDWHRNRLDEPRINFIRRSVRDLVDEINELDKAAAENPPTPVQSKSAVVVVLPANDEADEICGQMLANLLQREGVRATNVSQTSLAGEMLNTIETEHADLVCVSALPPAAVTHARYLCKRINFRFHDFPIVAGLWTVKGDTKKSAERISCGNQTNLTTTLGQAVDLIRQQTHMTIVASKRDVPPSIQP